MTDKAHHYQLEVIWEGSRGEGTKDYRAYGRNHRIVIAGKPDLFASADLTFRGDPAMHNPEELLVAALSSCHMLSYLALCARRGVNVIAYRDKATGTMATDATGGGHFTEVILHPHVAVADASQVQSATHLHEEAGRTCFIASSCNFPVRHVVTVESIVE